MTYDPNNIFARILRGEIPSKKIYENDYTMVIHDAFPQAPVHALVLPKKAYESLTDFSTTATEEEIIAFHRAISISLKELELEDNGYRVIANSGAHGGQEVPHFHLHIIGGVKLGAMLPKAS
jgi:diadenosine tetraphosphate (Ap4A) HIT family hydrolase